MDIDPRDTSHVGVKAGCLEGPLPWNEAQHVFCGSAVVEIPKDAKKWDAMPGVYEGWQPSKSVSAGRSNA